MRSPRALVGFGCSIVAAIALLSGCGGGSESSTGSTASASVQSRPAPPKGRFPSAEGKTLAEVLEADGAKPSKLSKIVVSPAAEVFRVGENRYPFGVFEQDRTQIPDAEVALYLAKVPKPKGAPAGGEAPGGEAGSGAERRALDEPAVGPYPAALETLQTEPQYRAKTTTSDPDAAAAVYATHVDFPSNGEWRIAALVRHNGELTTALLPSAVVGAYRKVPRVGQVAPRIHTPTAADVHGDLAKITTRIPPDTQNEVDYAEVIGKKPILLLFATPQFCQSRVCGPVVDVAEQLKHTYGKRIAFIHMEIYKDNDPNKGVRSQVKAFHLPSEPWMFAIGKNGRIENEIAGAFGVEELTRTIKGLLGE